LEKQGIERDEVIFGATFKQSTEGCFLQKLNVVFPQFRVKQELHFILMK